MDELGWLLEWEADDVLGITGGDGDGDGEDDDAPIGVGSI